MSGFDSDYNAASTKAQKLADQCKTLVRLRKVTGIQKGYAWNLVPSLAKQFGRDRDGELIIPTGMNDPRFSLETNPDRIG